MIAFWFFTKRFTEAIPHQSAPFPITVILLSNEIKGIKNIIP